VIDDHAYVGSANLDARSLNINYELLVRVSEPAVVKEARDLFGEILGQSRRVDLPAWRQSRSLWTKWLESWSYFVLARLDPYLARLSLGRRKS
jgi:cardiolipin synthase